MGGELAAGCSRREDVQAGHSASATTVDGELDVWRERVTDVGLVDCILLPTVRLSSRWAEYWRGAGRGIVAFVLLPTVSLLGLDPMRTNRFVDSGCACGLLI